jgi:hypothetical protein
LKNGDNYEFRLEGDKLVANGIYKGDKMKEQFLKAEEYAKMATLFL